MDAFDKIRSGLAGYKTYIILALLMATSLLEQHGAISADAASEWQEILLLGGGVTLTAKLARWQRPPQ